MKKKMSLLSILLFVTMLGLYGCSGENSENTMEDGVEQVEDAGEDMGDSMEDAGEEVGDETEDAADDVEDEMN